MSKRHVLPFLFILSFSHFAFGYASEVKVDKPELSGVDRGDRGPTKAISADHIQCLLNSGGISTELSKKTSESMSKAFDTAHLTQAQFSDEALLHFLAFSIGETGAGKIMTEVNPQSAAKTGYGFLQITGPDNLRKTAKCMNEVDPGSGAGLTGNAKATIGSSGQDTYKAALASVCFWRNNISMNPVHRSVSNGTDKHSTELMLRILGGGSVHGKIFDRASHRSVENDPTEVNRRWGIYSKLAAARSRCGV